MYDTCQKSFFMYMNKQACSFLLANNDENDYAFFKDVHEDLSFSAALKTVNDGIELIKLLGISFLNLSHIFPLDLNIPHKNGCECLLEMKLVNELKNLPIIIFSISLDNNVVDSLYKKRTKHCIQKLSDFSKFRKVILKALTVTSQNNFKQPAWANFILQS